MQKKKIYKKNWINKNSSLMNTQIKLKIYFKMNEINFSKIWIKKIYKILN